MFIPDQMIQRMIKTLEMCLFHSCLDSFKKAKLTEGGSPLGSGGRSRSSVSDEWLEMVN